MELLKLDQLNIAAKQPPTKKQTIALTPQENDKVEIKSKKSKAKKAAIGISILTLAEIVGVLAYSIGRNPAKAAKVLKGNSKVLEPAFKESQEFLQNLINKNSSNKTAFNNIVNSIKPNKHKSELSRSIEKLEDFINKEKPDGCEKIADTIKILKENLKTYHQKAEKALLNGEKETASIEQFAAENKVHAEKIEKYLSELRISPKIKSEQFSEISEISNGISPYLLDIKAKFNPGVIECPKELLPKDMIFYHGTQKAKNIYKEGFTPFASRQVEKYARELGAGIYITPDKKVATNFSGLTGSIIPVKISNDTKIGVISESVAKDLLKDFTKFINDSNAMTEYEKLSKIQQNALLENFFNKVFKDAGYDAVYCPKGIKAGGGILDFFTTDVNKMFGRKQSQLVLFTPEKLEITSRSFKDRVIDLKDKFSAVIQQIKYAKDNPLMF